MDQNMKEEPASPVQRVPSQSKTATRGESWWTRAKSSAVVRGLESGGSIVKQRLRGRLKQAVLFSRA
jgi:hypothetical protein